VEVDEEDEQKKKLKFFRASPMLCQIIVPMLKFSIGCKNHPPMQCQMMCQIWHMLYCVPNLAHNIAYAKFGTAINALFLITKIPLYIYF
jgi:fatty-acid desaturase